jgi:hypothetical protein
MTVIATTARIRPVTHAYVVPVVREIAPPRSSASATDW